MKLNYKYTAFACYIGYITQAICINFAPLLYVTFQKSYGISLFQVSLLIGFNFGIQFATDALFTKISDKINPRAGALTAQAISVLGLVGYSFLPDLLPDPYIGLVVCSLLCGVGGGMIEIMISPLMEACPTEHKSASMSLLHSFYCWGQAAVILFSTLFFTLFSIERWKILSSLWAIIPLVGFIMFTFVPIYKLNENEDNVTSGNLFKNKLFILFLLLMACAGASEMVFSQWASTFAEIGLGVNKTVGDIIGPCMFAILMGTTRILYALFSKRLHLERLMIMSMIACCFTYVIAALSPSPVTSLVACAFCGLTVGIMWPGIISIAASKIKNGGMSMFAFLALAGDFGCFIGPILAGAVANSASGGLKSAFLVCAVFPALATILLFILKNARLSRK